MYPEFIPIYAGLAVVLLVVIAILVLLIITLKKVNGRYGGVSSKFNPSVGSLVENKVFCRKCATQYSISESFCPKCGTSRQ